MSVHYNTCLTVRKLGSPDSRSVSGAMYRRQNEQNSMQPVAAEELNCLIEANCSKCVFASPGVTQQPVSGQHFKIIYYIDISSSGLRRRRHRHRRALVRWFVLGDIFTIVILLTATEM